MPDDRPDPSAPTGEACPERAGSPPAGAARRSARRTHAAVRDAAAALAALGYPDLCLGCDRRIPPRAAGDALAGLLLCPTCLAGLPAAGPPAVPALAEALAAGTVRGAFALWAYDGGGTVRRVQHAL